MITIIIWPQNSQKDTGFSLIVVVTMSLIHPQPGQVSLHQNLHKFWLRRWIISQNDEEKELKQKPLFPSFHYN